MKKFKVLTKPARLSDLSFDEMYDEMSSDWELKAERLQTRRWRKLRQQLV
jgi:hypothetical protein